MKILIAGDYCPLGRLATKITKRSYDIILGEIQPYTEQVDYSIVNLECPVCLGDYPPIYKYGPNLRVKTKNAVEALKYAGFDMVTLANNHILDYGEAGLRDTICVCHEFGIDVVGVGENIRAARQIFYKNIKHKTLAIINCCEHEFSIATETSGGAYPINPIQQFYQIHEARKNADVVLVIVHGGHEYFQLPSLRMKETYRFFIDAGADAVVNHHQHCFSGKEIYKGKPIYYGLGNFCFDMDSRSEKVFSVWNEGYMVELDFSADNLREREIPYIQCYKSSNIEIQKNTLAFYTKFRQLSEIIEDDERLKAAVHEYYDKATSLFDILWEPYENRYMRKLRMMKLIPSVISKRKFISFFDYINCEAHRDKLLYFLNMRNKA